MIKTSKYYGASLGCVLKSTFPSQALFEQNIEHKKKLYIHNPNLPELSTEQQNALNYINNITSKESSKTIVLHGVTGSGKTEIYFHFISKILNQGKQILLLVPEIGLSKQLVDQCTKRFNTSVSIWHSKIRKPLREKMFAQIVNNETKIIIGVRSVVFLPYKNLGCIIVDEEHDGSYKHENYFFYNARDLSVLAGYILKIPVILSSATPSLETMNNVQSKNMNIIT